VSFSTISYEVDDAGVARLTLDRPDAGNGVNLELARELMEATTECSEDRNVRAVLVRGAGANFCVGGDLREFGTMDGRLPLHLKHVTTYLHAAIASLVRLDAPVVAAVQGSAAGAGFSLVCSCDLVVAAESARFLMAYTKVGLSPDGSGSWFLPRLVGTRRALELALTNRRLSAEEAHSWGVVNRVVADDRLGEEAELLVNQLAAGATAALADAKHLLHDSWDNQLETQLEHETLALARNAGKDGLEGIRAFLEKRAPRFTGH
jgi:2-(1,2-epoxy-1,2-dihydrophenyl)acetyl-CoA isomerase